MISLLLNDNQLFPDHFFTTVDSHAVDSFCQLPCIKNVWKLTDAGAHQRSSCNISKVYGEGRVCKQG